MDIDFELDLLARAAHPEVVLDGLSMLPRVGDLIEEDDGSWVALVRSDPPQMISLRPGRASGSFRCSCGTCAPQRPCAHAVAATLARLRKEHGLSEARLERWERLVRALLARAEGRDRLAAAWVEAHAVGDRGSAGMILSDVGSVEDALDMARSFAPQVPEAVAAEFLLDVAGSRGIDETQRLSESAIADARELAGQLLGNDGERAGIVRLPMLLAIAGAARRTLTRPGEQLGLEVCLNWACAALADVVADHKDSAMAVATTLVAAEVASPPDAFPWLAVMMEALGPAARLIACAMRDALDRRGQVGWTAVDADVQYRIDAEIALAIGDPGLLIHTLEEWRSAPLGEFQRRLERPDGLAGQVAVMDAARRWDRLRWAPGWPSHDDLGLVPARALPVLEAIERSSSMRNVAVGDVVLRLAGRGSKEEARRVLVEHARRHDGTRHRAELDRVWDAAGLEERRAGELALLEEARDHDAEAFLHQVAMIPEQYFALRHGELAHGGLGVLLLAAALLVDIPDEGDRGNLEAFTVAFHAMRKAPNIADDLLALAVTWSLDLADLVEDAVRDGGRAGRAYRIAVTLAESEVPIRRRADAASMGPGELTALVGSDEQGDAQVAEIVSILLGATTLRPGPSFDAFASRAAGSSAARGRDLLEAAFAVEPRGADLGAYELGIALWEMSTAR